MQVDEEKCEIAALKAQIQRLERQLAISKIVSQPPQAEPGQSSPSVPGPSSQLPTPGTSSQLPASKISSQPTKSSIVLKLTQPRVPESSQLSSEKRK